MRKSSADRCKKLVSCFDNEEKSKCIFTLKSCSVFLFLVTRCLNALQEKIHTYLLFWNYKLIEIRISAIVAYLCGLYRFTRIADVLIRITLIDCCKEHCEELEHAKK